jgi:hypothetical protein
MPIYLLNVSGSLNFNIKGDSPKHFLLQNKDNMFLVSKCRLISLLASCYQIRESKSPYSIILVRCPLSSYYNSLSRDLIQSMKRSSELRYS